MCNIFSKKDLHKTGRIIFIGDDSMEKTKLKQLEEELSLCQECSLRNDCIAPVGWFGAEDTPLVIVGEGPGKDEDEYGCPLIGKSGQLLNKALFSVGVTRDRIITTNTVKCRPMGNKTPSISEGSFCASRWLERELEIIKPQVVIALGSVALHYLIDPDARITRDRGKWFQTKGGIPCIATYHPAYLLRQYGESLKKAKWEVYYDLKAAVDKCKETHPDYIFSSDPPPDLFKIFSKRA